MKHVKIFLIILIACCLLSGCSKEVDYTCYVNSTYSATPAKIFVDEFGNKSINLNENRNLKVLQLTDIHLANGPFSSKKDIMAIKAVCTLIENSNPDLIIISGDIVFPVLLMTGTNDNLTALKVFSKVIEKYKTPWTLCFGNHDSEHNSKYSKTDLCNFLESDNLSYCLFSRGENNVDGMGNHIVNLYKNNNFVSSIFLFDNGMYNKKTQLSGYKEISISQTSWYKENILNLNSYFKKTISSYVFYHVPGKEYKEGWENLKLKKNNTKYFFGNANEKNEKISCPSEIGTFFEKVKELSSTKAIFCGHDHFNDFSIEYDGIRLTYGKSIDYIAYTLKGIATKTNQRGATLLEIIDEENFDISQIKLTDIT